jgi:hypothetical protein
VSLDDFTTEKESWRQYKKYNLTDKDKKVEQIVDELRELFPVELEMDFIEVSPAMEGLNGWAYWRRDNGEVYQFIRVSEHLVDHGGYRLRSVILHEMVHILFYNMGYREGNPHKPDVSDGHPAFHWVLGAVGANISQVNTKSDVWQEVCEMFIEEGHGLKSNENTGSLVKREPEN